MAEGVPDSRKVEMLENVIKDMMQQAAEDQKRIRELEERLRKYDPPSEDVKLELNIDIMPSPFGPIDEGYYSGLDAEERKEYLGRITK